MGLTRVFYGHEGSIPPLGLYASAEAEPAEIAEAIVEEIVLPDSKAKAAELDAFAEEHGIDHKWLMAALVPLVVVSAWLGMRWAKVAGSPSWMLFRCSKPSMTCTPRGRFWRN